VAGLVGETGWAPELLVMTRPHYLYQI